MGDPYVTLREHMVSEQIEGRGVHDSRVLEAMRSVLRHVFVPEPERIFAYADQPLPIGYGQTISQPYIVAYMTEALGVGAGDIVLEVGSGCGYQAAILAMLAEWVYTVERVPELAERAQATLRKSGYRNVSCKTGDGTLGWEEVAPFDAIMVTASGPEVPFPLKEQLAVGGTLVMPVGSLERGQRIVRVRREGKDRFQIKDLLDVAFVPLIGEHGW